ncbi:MAG: DNA mismatch repair protein MutS [Tannerellaceae bacterium]|jgi:hypothetical protein|nr:DNA mismatch repair protein MutS [Tannerellaceae bacterium]
MKKVYHYYENRIENASRRLISLQKKIHSLGTIRLLLVIGALITAWFVREQDWKLIAGVLLLYAVPFVVLMVYHNLLSQKKSYEEALIDLCSNELKGLNYDFSAFDGAPEKAEGEHAFCLDLDIFGERSFFQSLNRTVTHMGREQLADWFINPLTDKEAILQRQEAVKELAPLIRLRQDFYVNGVLCPGNPDDVRLLANLSSPSGYFVNRLFWRASVWFVPLLWLIVAVGVISGYLSLTVCNLLFILSFLTAYIRLRQINELHKTVNKLEKILLRYSELIKIIEKETFTSGLLSGLSRQLACSQGTASRAIRKLSSHIGILDQRATFTAILLNIFTFRDIRASIAIERWKEEHGAKTGDWFEALSCFDALSSLAGFAFNHPGYTYPAFVGSYFEISGKSLGHPLIPRDVCVKNDISIGQSPCFLIITGANMAGKSTYLRTVGINFVLAMTGAPVCAGELRVYPARLVTSLRTSDSLISNESYFFAELKRLKMIIDRLHKGEKLFIILDEILKGTNSTDKQKGSFALMKQLLAYKTHGIIATHDLALGSLERDFPTQIKNYRFEADITGDTLTFSYQLREGIAQNMNATFLMQQMGITIA